MINDTVGLKIRINGIVQGVGFRPFVYTQAVRRQLTGWVRNTSSGVEIEVNGSPREVNTFLKSLQMSAPPLAKIDHLESQPCIPNGYQSFNIITSQPKPGEYIPISPDVSICSDCRRELFALTNRRYRYPFINCTNCGPRFTIIRDIPYDRPKTTMSSFKMCPECHKEYKDPLDRRFHTQPIACPNCGPRLWFESNNNTLCEREEALQLARSWLRQGKIIAIKGLGGFHLACDATNQDAVSELRQRKQRSDKPFALMGFNVEMIKRHCYVTSAEHELLQSRQRPVVLLKRRQGSSIVPEVAPNLQTLAFMLPYTPLHLLLLEPEPGFPEALVMTSGNLSEEPIAYKNDEARQRLKDLADGILLHDRPIHIRVDDSVTRVINQHPYHIRRARGYVPSTIKLPHSVPEILATGSELKNTFCLTRDNYAFISHHIGDMENNETLSSFESGIEHFEKLFRIQPKIFASDLHPDYLATQYAQQRAHEDNIPLVQVQHHHAHLAACLADNGWSSKEPVIGLIFDGMGLGTDGAIWGGEYLFGNYRGYRRMYHIAYVPMPGGDIAIHKPSRMALSILRHTGIDWPPDLPPVKATSAEEQTVILAQLDQRLNSPATSSMGRLFDTASALLGICQKATYEGQAAIELEALVDLEENIYYEFQIEKDIIDPNPLWHSLIKDWRAGTPIHTLAAKFHNSIVRLNLDICETIRKQTTCNVVVLSGGVWQNYYLLEHTIKLLENNGFQVLTHRQVPTNDGGISLGQAMVAASVSEK